ncbi:gastrula zinc finger protein XlCGF49.1-like [Macrobrachium rosenbergii]|uniref:gastrula zinc finger protein XlCGF49.1-like n=1 Tax=Macrobrachium rosenbergii TaxID=79674 RepID=UPI0034D3B4D3
MSLVKSENGGLVGSDAPACCTSVSLDPVMEIKTEVKMEVEVCYESDGDMKHHCADGEGDSLHVRKEARQGEDLSTHMEIHRGGPFSCNDCGKSFSQKSTQDPHGDPHRERAFCARTVGSRSPRNQLSRPTWRSTQGEAFVCKDCGKSFYKKSYLERHMAIHTGRGPSDARTVGSHSPRNQISRLTWQSTQWRSPTCVNNCGKSFIRKSRLKTHMAIHTGRGLVCKE